VNGTSDVRTTPAMQVTSALLFVCYLGALAAIAFVFREMINPDAVPYMRIAHYWAEGNRSLMISGTWGPLFSWLMVPLLWLQFPAFVAARLLMAFCAVLFVCSVATLFRAFRFPLPVTLGATAVAAVAALYWSVAQITPDMLLAAIVTGGFATVFSGRWIDSLAVSVLTGALFGFGYLAKPIGFPLGITFIAAAAFVGVFAFRAGVTLVLRQTLMMLLGFAAVTLPWIATLSAEYGRTTYTTATVGFAGGDRHPTFNTLHRPSAGRITSFEDPARELPNDPDAFLHDVGLRSLLDTARVRFPPLVRDLAGFDLLRLSLLAVLAAVLMFRPFHRGLMTWSWAVVPVVLVILPYSITYGMGTQRYLYPIYAFLLVCAFGLWNWIVERTQSGHTWHGLAGYVLIAFSFAYPPVATLVKGFPEVRLFGAPARDAARQLERAGSVPGSIAGASPSGLLVSFFLERPWYGDDPDASGDDFHRSGAEVILVWKRDKALIEQMSRDARFGRVGATGEDGQFPSGLVIYRRKGA